MAGSTGYISDSIGASTAGLGTLEGTALGAGGGESGVLGYRVGSLRGRRVAAIAFCLAFTIDPYLRYHSHRNFCSFRCSSFQKFCRTESMLSSRAMVARGEVPG